MKNIVIFLFVFLGTLTGMSGDFAQIKTLTQKRLEIISKRIEANPPKQIPSIFIGTLNNNADWIVSNLDCLDGWCLTGYSWGSLNEDFTLKKRIKIGLIPIYDEYAPLGSTFVEEQLWRILRSGSGIPNASSAIGIHFTFTF